MKKVKYNKDREKGFLGTASVIIGLASLISSGIMGGIQMSKQKKAAQEQKEYMEEQERETNKLNNNIMSNNFRQGFNQATEITKTRANYDKFNILGNSFAPRTINETENQSLMKCGGKRKVRKCGGRTKAEFGIISKYLSNPDNLAGVQSIIGSAQGLLNQGFTFGNNMIKDKYRYKPKVQNQLQESFDFSSYLR